MQEDKKGEMKMSQTNKPPVKSRDIRNTADLIGTLRDGNLSNEIMDAHRQILEACEDTGKKGSMTIKIEYGIVKSLNGHAVNIAASVAKKMPYLKQIDNFNLHPGQLLSDRMVDQLEMSEVTTAQEPATTVSVQEESNSSVSKIR